MGSPDWAYIPGDHHVICDVCGFKYRKSDMRLRWDNVWCCPEDWETRHPQDFVTARIDVIVVTPQRPPPTDEFIGELCTAEGRAGIAGYGVADCSICDLIVGI